MEESGGGIAGKGYGSFWQGFHRKGMLGKGKTSKKNLLRFFPVVFLVDPPGLLERDNLGAHCPLCLWPAWVLRSPVC